MWWYRLGAAQRPKQNSRKAPGSAGAMSAGPGGHNPSRKDTGIPEQCWKNT